MPSALPSERDVLDHIKRHLLLGRLELSDLGLTLESIADDVPLLDESGLGLDSVEALDLLVGVEKSYGFHIQQIDKSFIESTCYSTRSLAHYVLARLAEQKATA